jgi:hypothetical protein
MNNINYKIANGNFDDIIIHYAKSQSDFAIIHCSLKVTK